ncbi:efflux transporter outer membrane subunit [Rhodovarius crocodyli]|uniref:Efflux transporter outer membrane subunit n=1 Tax=Rhodovarius crocodyli TaxID=1979269 RepID=A0A437MFI6_9PROT|nr:efflux transporter outer membrane subunit [Rhodovarius crocodyli]RVT96385.1 efflux transporter outer membrane subunit [Rhodovarius crocodyli]
MTLQPFLAAPTIRRRLTLLAPLALAACSVGPDYALPRLGLPARWAGAPPQPPTEAEQPLGHWWRLLDDPLLDTLIEEAVRGNLDVASAAASIREARAARASSQGALLPSVSGGASASRSRSSARTASQFQAGLDAAWELDLFGGNRRALEASTAALDAAEYSLRSVLLTLVGEVATTYVELRGYQARLDLTRRTAASQRQTAAMTQGLYRAGSSSALDVARANATAASTEAQIPVLEISYASSLFSLGLLLGQPPAALAPRLETARPIPEPRRMTGVGVPGDLLRARPDLRAAERQLAQATALIGQAEANRYPSISVSGTLSISAARMGDLARNSALAWSFGPSLNIPIFQGGQLAAAVRQAEAQRDQYYIAFRAAVLTALQEVETALVTLTQQRERVARLTETVTAQREAARLSRTLYQTGASGFLDVLDADRTLFSAEDSLLQSRIATVTAFVALNKALGGGWDGEIDTRSPAVQDTGTGPRLRTTTP